jgi:hypothetical protein
VDVLVRIGDACAPVHSIPGANSAPSPAAPLVSHPSRAHRSPWALLFQAITSLRGSSTLALPDISPFRMSKPLSTNGATGSRLLRAVVLLRKLLSKPRRSNESTAPARTSNHVHYLLRAPTPALRPGWSYSLERQITCTSVCVSESRCPKPNRSRRARAAHTAFCVSEPHGNGDPNAGSRCSPNRQSRANHAPMSLLATFRSDRSHGFTVPAHDD